MDDARRARVFSSLRKSIGLRPEALLAASPAKINEAIRQGGMQPAHRAGKIRRCAEIALHFAPSGLARTLRTLPPQKARALLKRFPGIADPGADKVLLLCGLSEEPALDSNGLRVLERLGYVGPDTAYARQYRNAINALSAAGISGAKALDAFVLLREHGRELCKRSVPLCPLCPVRAQCAFARARGI